MAILIAGLVMGIRHAADADHLLAVATLVGPRRDVRDLLRVGLYWGLGHTASLALVVLVLSGLGIVVSQRLEVLFEVPVGMMLIVLGGISLLRFRWWRPYVEPHPSPPCRDAIVPDNSSAFALRPSCAGSFSVGLVHGIAGSAVIAVLAGAALGSPLLATAFALLVGAGSLIGMTAITLLFSLPLAVSGKADVIYSNLALLAGCLSLAWGATIIWVALG